MAALRLEIVTPDQVVLSTDVDYVGAPGVDGEFGVLAGQTLVIQFDRYYRNYFHFSSTS